MNTQQTIVNWNKPSETPQVEVGTTKEFWIAVESRYPNRQVRQYVFCAQYVNMPVYIDDEGEPNTDDYLVTVDGEPFHAVGWHSVKNHADFDNYYEPLTFNEEYVLLGWADYIKPEFNGSGMAG